MVSACAAAAIASGTGAAAATAATATTTTAVTTTPAPPVVNTAAAAAQCSMSFGLPKTNDATVAAALMAGHVDLGKYGTFTLAADPNWLPVSTLDSSGDAYINSLHYLLPLLREGVRTGNTAMVNRFYWLLWDWLRDSPPSSTGGGRGWTNSIYEGYRALVLTCAAAGPRGNEVWLRNGLALHLKELDLASRYEGANNAALHQQMGLLAIAATLNRPDVAGHAVARISSLAARLVNADGSDGEGAPAYALDDYAWLAQAAERIRRAGLTVPSTLARINAVPGFVAQAIRPDGQLESLGDTTLQKVGPADLPGADFDAAGLRYAATAGAAGTPGTSLYSSFRGGYVFGRSGWGQAQPLSQETWYSLRWGTRYRVPHAHDDAQSLTLYSRGAELLADPGQWRYLSGAVRSWVVSRLAHNTVVVAGRSHSSLPAPALTTATTGDLDVTTIVDRGYSGVTLLRTVVYDRSRDLVVVWDRLTSTSRVTAYQQWQLAAGLTTSVTGDTVTATGSRAGVTALFAGGGAGISSVAGQHSPLRGWVSPAYGVLTPAPSVQAQQSGTSLSWVTVLAPRDAGDDGAGLTATAVTTGNGAIVELPGGDPATGVLHLSADSSNHVSAVRDSAGVSTTVLLSSASLVKSGTGVWFAERGLEPGARGTLEAVPADPVTGQPLPGAAWTPVATLTAGRAGTAMVKLPVTRTTAYRLTNDARTPSARVLVRAGVAPGPVTGVTAKVVARATTKGTVHDVVLTWRNPASTGGLPLTSLGATLKGATTRTLSVRPTWTMATFPAVPAGSWTANVVARNAIGSSGAVAVAATVPK
ncbi:MAG: heparinase II/III domain-containing protein [Actinomycetales bacterium]